jgi:hypothetical protein
MNKEIKAKRMIIIDTAAFFISVGAFFVLNRLYQNTYKTLWTGVFGKANNSIWEQTKIVFFTFVLLSFFEFFLADVSFIRFFVAKTLGMLFITFALPAFLYGYMGATGLDFEEIDTAGAVIILFFAFVISCKTTLHKNNNKRFILSFVCFAVMLSCFLSLTVFAPDIPLFKDPKTGVVGLDNHPILVSANTLFT